MGQNLPQPGQPPCPAPSNRSKSRQARHRLLHQVGRRPSAAARFRPATGPQNPGTNGTVRKAAPALGVACCAPLDQRRKPTDAITQSSSLPCEERRKRMDMADFVYLVHGQPFYRYRSHDKTSADVRTGDDFRRRPADSRRPSSGTGGAIPRKSGTTAGCAWVEVGEAGASQRRIARPEAAAGNYRGPLHGIPVGIKDIIDVAGMSAGRCRCRRTIKRYDAFGGRLSPRRDHPSRQDSKG